MSRKRSRDETEPTRAPARAPKKSRTGSGNGKGRTRKGAKAGPTGTKKKHRDIGWRWVEDGVKPDGKTQWIRVAKPGFATVRYTVTRFMRSSSAKFHKLVESDPPGLEVEDL
jgi:hypothetical protein